MAGIVTFGCSREKPAVPPPVPPEAAEVGSSGGRFAGSESCRECHAAEYAAWSRSRHRTTLRAWEPGQPLRLAAAQSAGSYRVAADGTASAAGTDGKPVTGKVAFLVGGKHREEALVRLPDGRLQVFPLALDADAGRTFEPLKELAGGAPPPPDSIEFFTRVGRNADLACYGCHATGQVLTEGGRSPEGLVLPTSRWSEPGVGCEACHGPAGAHVASARDGHPDQAALRMRRGATDVVDACAACHGLREVLPSPFAAAPAHRYGEPLFAAADPLLSHGSNLEFREPFFPDLRPATYQQEAVAFSQSGCALRGGLRCAACHDTHSGELLPALGAPDGGDSVCAPCHAAVAAQGKRHAVHAPGTPGGRCLDCHMAKIVRGPARDAARDHTLSPPVAAGGQIPAACASCHAGGRSTAAVIAAWKGRAAGASARRRADIGAAFESGAAADLARMVDDPGRGWFLRWAAIEHLGAAAGPLPESALAPVRRALTDPNPALRRAAAHALGFVGAASDVEALQRATDDADPWTALEAAHAMGQRGAPTTGARLLQLLKRPDLIADARAQYLYGHACLVGQDLPHAEKALRRALELNPMMVGAINDLGLTLLGQGRRDEARAAWRRALEINPRFGSAKQNLDALLEPQATR